MLTPATKHNNERVAVMPAIRLPVGSQFGRLTVIAIAASIRGGNGKCQSASLCRCDCGREVIVRNYCLRMGSTRSCGCLLPQVTTQRCTTHGHSSRTGMTKTYHAWANMIQRCENPNNHSYCDYGGRGIQVCERWRSSFVNFLSDMGEAPAGLTLDRRDNDGPYSPANCRWETTPEQRRNGRKIITVTVRGVSGCLKDVCSHFGVSYNRVRARIRRGWETETAFFAPLIIRRWR